MADELQKLVHRLISDAQGEQNIQAAFLNSTRESFDSIKQHI